MPLFCFNVHKSWNLAIDYLAKWRDVLDVSRMGRTFYARNIGGECIWGMKFRSRNGFVRSRVINVIISQPRS